MSTSPISWVDIGFAVRPRGLRGDLVVRGETRDLELIDVGMSVRLTRSDGEHVRQVERVSSMKGGVSVKVTGIDDRDEAERWRNVAVGVDGEKLPAPNADEFHWSQVDGFDVVTVDGGHVGVVTGRFPSAAHEILRVHSDDAGERLIPAVDAVIVSIDPDARRVTIDPPPGLLDLNA